MSITKHEVRTKWLGGKSIGQFQSESEVRQHFTSEGLMPIMGNMYSFEEADAACTVALSMWQELQQWRVEGASK